MTNTKITKEAYDKKSEEYHKKLISSDGSFWNNFLEIPMRKILKEISKNKKILDLGCGSGIRTKKLFSLNPRKIVGLDLSPELIKIAKNNFSEIEFHSGDAKKTGFKNSEFDIINSDLMVHYFKSLNPLFKEVGRILKPKGYFVFSMHHPIYEVTKREKEKNKTKYLLEPYFHNELYKWKMLEGMELISYHHTFEDIFSSLKQNGFVIDELIEPHAINSKKKFDKKHIERATKYPSFLIIKAKKL
ncbi:class I SAM-dependent methyltransferase [Candidatus Pacearchaeota archaeon]|nr:class I SAM-dependent methyltransferase [Candidatus Pacearchaeota archaeon]